MRACSLTTNRIGGTGMRCHYVSDLHLEAQDFPYALAGGDVLIIAGDLCQASALVPARQNPYRAKQRERVLRLVDGALRRFRHVLMVAGNHEHHDGLFEETVPLLKRHLNGVTVLDNEAASIDGVRFFGTTLWTDFEGRSEPAMERARRGTGDYFFSRTHHGAPAGRAAVRLTPTDTLQAHERALAALRRHVTGEESGPTVVITHHAPSRLGLNPAHKGNGLDGSFASDLDAFIATLRHVPFWVHGHTHVRRRYRIGATTVLVNCRGFAGRDLSARRFSPDPFFEVAQDQATYAEATGALAAPAR